MTRPRADVREADLLQQRPDMTLMIVDAEAFGNHPFEIDAPPADHAVNLPIGTGIDDGRQFRSLSRRQSRRRTTRPIVQQPLGAGFIEAMNPVAQGLRAGLKKKLSDFSEL